MILHTINKTPFESDTLRSCLKFISPSDAIIFIENGVYTIQTTQFTEQLSSLTTSNIKLYALINDTKARAIDIESSTPVELIDYTQFVKICTQYDVIQSW